MVPAEPGAPYGRAGAWSQALCPLAGVGEPGEELDDFELSGSGDLGMEGAMGKPWVPV